MKAITASKLVLSSSNRQTHIILPEVLRTFTAPLKVHHQEREDTVTMASSDEPSETKK
jgi:hypothetical protein